MLSLMTPHHTRDTQRGQAIDGRHATLQAGYIVKAPGRPWEIAGCSARRYGNVERPGPCEGLCVRAPSPMFSDLVGFKVKEKGAAASLRTAAPLFIV